MTLRGSIAACMETRWYAAKGCNVRVSAVLRCAEVMVSEGSGVFFLESMVEVSSSAGVSLDPVKT